MKALVVYACINHSKNQQIDVHNCITEFLGDNPTLSEILTFKEKHSKYPDICEPKIINIIKLDE